MEYELRPIHDSRKSFYRKAWVEESEDGSKMLWSYGTCVAYTNTDGSLRVLGEYSNTTVRHIKEFMRQNGFKCDSIKDVRAYI